MVFPILIVESDLGSTDCSGCRFFRRGHHIFAQQTQNQDPYRRGKFVSLPLKVATFGTVAVAEEALARVDEARRLRKGSVNLKDLVS